MGDVLSQQQQHVHPDGTISYDLFTAPLTIAGADASGAYPQLTLFGPVDVAGERAGLRFSVGPAWDVRLRTTRGGPWLSLAAGDDSDVIIFDHPAADKTTIDLGPAIGGRQADAGKIGYQTFTAGAFDIVGAGTVSGARAVKLWDNVLVPGGGARLELGHGVAGKEASAGVIGYAKFSDGLDLVGGGVAVGARKVTLFDFLRLSLRPDNSDPATDAAGGLLYVKANGELWFKDPAGLVTRLAI